MGIAGAGLSTAISQYISTIILLLPFFTGKTVTKIHIRYITKDIADIGNILLTGLPSLARQGLNSISTAVLNQQAAVYGDAAIAAMSIVGRCGNLLFSFALGIAQGFQPVSAFNYGAGKKERVEKATWFTMLFGMAIMGILCLGCGFAAPLVIRLFREEQSVLDTGTEALRWMCFTLYILPVSAVGSMLFQSIGKKGSSLLIAMLQGGMISIPLMLFLPHFLGVTGIEIAQPCAYVISALVSFPIMISFFKKLR